MSNAPTARPPNILWISTDRQRFDTLGCYGNGLVKTPHLDALAAAGTRFESAYSQCPICSPSRASFMTGRYPRTTGLCRNGQAIPPTERLVPRLLADAGYYCGHAGKMHLAPGAPEITQWCERRIDDGYSVFDWSLHPPGPPDSAYTKWLTDNNITFARQPVVDCPYIEVGMPAETSNPGWTAQRAIDFVHTNQSTNRPWFFTCNFEAPHNPFDPPEPFLRRYLDRLDEIPLPAYTPGELANKPPFQQTDREGVWGGCTGYFACDKMSDRDHRYIRAAYWALCDHIDYEVGRVVAALRETGQLENTLMVYLSDHGEMLGDHGIYFQGAYFYDAMTHVPLIMAMPGTTPRQNSNALVELVDVAPTLIEAAGLPRYAGMQGRSLWPLMTGTASATEHRTDVYGEYYQSIPNGYRQHGGAHLTAIRSRDFALTAVHNHELGELYDLKRDPGEVRNLWDDPNYLAVKARLLKRLSDRMAETIDPLPPTESGF